MVWQACDAAGLDPLSHRSSFEVRRERIHSPHIYRRVIRESYSANPDPRVQERKERKETGMKVTTYAMMAGVVLALGLLPNSSEAFCPCAGTPGNNTGACAAASTPGDLFLGPNGCTADPTGLIGTDGKGCIEDLDADMDGNCEVCVGGSVVGGTGTLPMPPIERGVQGCLCVRNEEVEDDYVCISLPGEPIDDMDPTDPMPVQLTVDECMANATAGCS